MCMKIYIANLAKYNEGKLKGEWLPLPTDKDTIDDTLKRILGEDEECAIHDFESDELSNLNIGEWENIYTLNEQAERLEGLIEQYSADIVSIALDEYGSIEKAITVLEDGDFTYYNDIDSEEDLGYAVVDDGTFGVTIPNELARYIDYEAIGRDMTCDGWTIYHKYSIAIYFY